MTDRDRDADVVEVARRVAADVLLPASDTLDRSGRPPVAQLQALADAGLYGLAGPVAAGGSDRDLVTMCRVVESLAGACLTTTFIWIQHHGVVRAVRRAEEPLRRRHLAGLCLGRERAGVVLAGLKPGPSAVLAHDAGGRWSLSGTVPWFTGWDQVDVALVAARTPDEQVLLTLLDLAPGDRTLTFTPQRLLALQSSATGSLTFDATPVPAERVLGIEPLGGWSDSGGLRLNGALGLGVAARCVAELGDDGMRPELERLRTDLHEGDDDSVATVRAEIAAFASRCAAALLAGQGSRGIRGPGTAARRYREAGFLLTFGQRPAIKAHLLELLEGAAPPSVEP
jgi:alkylation response protein AidB-like acyl-CoA dehydrogenase